MLDTWYQQQLQEETAQRDAELLQKSRLGFSFEGQMSLEEQDLSFVKDLATTCQVREDYPACEHLTTLLSAAKQIRAFCSQSTLLTSPAMSAQ